MHGLCTLGCAMKTVLSSALVAAVLAGTTLADNWQDQAINPVTNPVFFESPLVQSEIRPIFMSQRLDPGFLGAPVDARIYAVQLRYAITDRLAIIATKDGYVELNPKGPAKSNGWADLAAGLKYALIRSDKHQFVLTPGFTFEIPTGNHNVFQGNGGGELNLFVSAMKGWGNLHATASLGGRIPFDFSRETASVRYSAQLDYWVCRWFIPFVSFNAFTTTSNAKALPFTNEGFDLINFGATSASGHTQGALGGGFRTRILSNLDFGIAYEYGLIDRNDVLKDRITADLIWRF